MLIEQLNKAWATQRNSTAVVPVMCFAREGLMLGAGTVLAKSAGSARDISIDTAEPRLRALLVAAHLRSPTLESLSHLRKAAQRWSEGQDALAAMHLALSGLERLVRPEADANRLFLADRLMRAGLEPNAIIEAIEPGDSALDRLQKYDPDQPRVPAGSGRTSGQWTSTEGGASSEDNPPNSARPEVNPDTVTQVTDPQYETPYACEIARVRCREAAFLASAGDAANDNGPRNMDLKSCEDAANTCKLMSVGMQIQPLPLGGGVRFPNGALVLIYKGRVDRYINPRPGNQSPSIRRSLEAGGQGPQSKGQTSESYSSPPCVPGTDETAPSSSAGFSECEQGVKALASMIDGEVIHPTTSLSKQWGKIVRAKIVLERRGALGTAFLTCWSSSPPDVFFDVRFDCCGDCADQ